MYILKFPNDSVKNFEWLKICGLEIVCSIEILWAIHDCGCHSVGISPELLRTIFTLTRMSKCSYLRTKIPPLARRSSLNLRNFSGRSFVHTATGILRLIIIGKMQRRRILNILIRQSAFVSVILDSRVLMARTLQAFRNFSSHILLKFPQGL
ncbi:hypothetical protein EDD22DRAFT_868720, partial [Suillus occidentalis]